MPAQDRGDIRHNIILELVNGDGDTTKLIETIADDKAIKLEAWLDARTWRGVLGIVPFGGPWGTVPELLFEKKGLIPAIQQLLISH